MPTARTPAEILEYHQRSVEALRRLGRSFATLTPAEQAVFPGTEEAFRDALIAMRDELDDQVVLALVASAERALRLDYTERLGDGTAAGASFGHLRARYEDRVPLEEIVEVWKRVANASQQGGDFKALYAYRHGLAHGRYFNKSGLHDATPGDANDRIEELFRLIHAHTGDFPRG